MLEPSNLRERSFYNGTDTVQTFSGTGTVSWHHGNYISHNWRNYSSIVDRINPKGPGGFRAPGPCFHTKMSASECLPTSSGWTDGHETWGYDYSLADEYHSAALPAEVSSVLPTIPITKLLGLRLAAWKKFHTVIPEDVSVANFLYELKDFKDIVPNLNKARKLKSVPKAKFSKVPAVANSTFLAYNFAWAPFVGDLLKMRAMMDNIPKRLKFLKDSRGKPTRVHFRADNIWSDPGPYDEVGDMVYWHREAPGNPYQNDHTFHFLRNLSYSAKFSASCTIKQEIEGLDDAMTGVKAAYASLGLNNPFKIVWNAVPFSFMIDWVAPVGDMLGVLAANPFTGRWDVFDVTNSITEDMSFSDNNNIYFNNPAAKGDTYMRKIDVQRYSRWLGLQLTSDDVELSSLSNHQQRLFASLVAGNTLFKGHR